MADTIERSMPALRLNMAFAAVTGTGPNTGTVFADWAKTVTPAQGDVRYSALTNPGVNRIGWRVDGDPQAMLEGLGGWLMEFGLADAEAQRFTKITAVLEPARLGGIIEYHDGLDAGWYLPLDASVYDVLVLEDDNHTETVHDLAGWCERKDVQRCSRLVRFVGRAQSEVWMPIPGAGETAMAIALDAFDAVGQLTVPDAARAALTEAAGGGIDVVSGHRDGVISLGIHVRRPTTNQVLALARQVANRDEVRLAVFEGALGVDGAAGAEYRVFANRAELRLYYDVA